MYALFSFSAPLIYAIIGLFNPKVRKINAGRKNTMMRVEQWLKTLDGKEKIYWIHAASLGEFDQLLPVIRLLKDKRENRVIVSFFSPSGFENIKEDAIDLKFYLPADTPKKMGQLVSRINPRKIIFSKYDIWPNFIMSAIRNKIPLILTGLEINSNHFALRHPSSLRSNLLSEFQFLLTNTTEGADKLMAAGYAQAHFTGSPKIEQSGTIVSQPWSNEIIHKFCTGHFTVIGGSVWEPELQLLKQLSEELPDIKFIIAPHEPTQAMLQRIDGLFGDLAIRLSKISGADLEKSVLVIDTVGQLKFIYRYGDIALIGGGFGAGIHNILEAAAYGLAEIAGPAWEKFSEAHQLKAMEAFWPVNNYSEFHQVITMLKNDDHKRKTIHNSLSLFFNKNKFASADILKYIEA